MQSDIAAHAATLGYVLMGGIFVFAGIDHFRNFAAVKTMMASRGWPIAGPLLAIISALQILGGVCLAFGPFRPWAALGLVAFTIAATLSFLDFLRTNSPDRMWMRSEFIINVGLLGGLLLAFATSI